MKSGYKIEWTDFALGELEATFNYLETNCSDREMKNLALEIEAVLKLITNNPKTFQKTEFAGVRKVIVKKHNTLFYREKNEEIIEILSFFSNKQSPLKRKY